MKARTYIGTSGWHYKDWVGRFYPEKCSGDKMFQYYMQFFDTVEINNSFYRLPSPETFRLWNERSPEHFLFAVKASRFITHNKKLIDPADSLGRLFNSASELGKKLGPVLFQLPPRWNYNGERLEAFLKALPNDQRFTMEFRHPSWYNEEAFNLLRMYKVSFCIYELEYHQSPMEITSDFVYIRLHGPGLKYQGSYKLSELKMWAKRCFQWNEEGLDVYIYFDNDQLGHAVQNALSLKKLLKKGA